ncbi:MAG: hypothetical protein ABIQ33_13905 [Caldimonas sp.]
MSSAQNHRKLTILAQDPGVKVAGRIAFASVDVANEIVADGPTGHRVKVIDFDASANVLYAPRVFGADAKGQASDPFRPKAWKSAAARRKWEAATLANPAFHAQNVYAIAMRTLARFERALGRRVRWSFPGHQISIAPHAFCDANAYYSEADRAIFFGYFRSPTSRKTVFTCLSHDIVAHETTHALLDGLRDGFTDPSTPDQAAFHEGFADVVALLSVFSLKEIVEAALLGDRRAPAMRKHNRLIPAAALRLEALADSMLLGVGEQFGAETGGARANALRRSAALKPNRGYLAQARFQEEHDRGEVFAAAMLRSFLLMWTKRIAALGTFEGDKYNLERVIEEGAKAADNLLTMAIRALDYCPPVDLTFGDYLAAFLTADAQTVPDDSRYAYRALVRATFESYGITVPARLTVRATGEWRQFDPAAEIAYDRTHFDSMLHDSEEVFRFVWENRKALKIGAAGELHINSVRPSIRQGQDGFLLRETVCEYVQVLRLFSSELEKLVGIERPADMASNVMLTVYGGGTLIFDEYGRIKYHVAQRLEDGPRQAARLDYLWKNDLIGSARDSGGRFADMHRNRTL